MLPWEIKQAEFKSDFSIEVLFTDGLKGTVKILPSRLIKVFSPLKDIHLFLKGYVKHGAITWNVGEYELDLAPDTMHHKIKENNGVYLMK